MIFAWIKTAVVAAAVSVFAWSAKAERLSFNVETRVGDGWHMASTVTLDSAGSIAGTTTLKNYNNVRGFTGGVFAVALDARGEALYATEIHSYGINASFFKKSVTRTVTWSDTIPAEYLAKVDKVAVIQMHNPTNRVWTWIYNNRATLIAHAKAIANLYKEYQAGTLDAQDVTELVKAHLAKI